MFVVGTAGHVDHGKSSLVHRLTGIDPDRLREERERAMTIDLGFAWLTLPSGREISIIDVPGHERFIHNMLAGVGGFDAALLVVAADEGPMPQTREHLAILDLLAIERGVVALTKADLVDQDWLAFVTDETRSALQGTSLASATVCPVSSVTGHGVDALLSTLDQVLATAPAPADVGRPRLAVDRAFTIGGFGTVVTGTLLDGRLAVGSDVVVLPAGHRARIRGLQSHQRQVQAVEPGTRVAVNLSGLAVADLRRGDVVTLPGLHQATERFDAEVRLVDTAPRPLRTGDALDLFIGATEVMARVSVLDVGHIAPGDSGWAQFRLAHPVVAQRGDRFVLRQPSPSCTIGGGLVVDAHARRHARSDPDVVRRLATLRTGSPAERLMQTLARAPLELRQAADAAHLTLDEARSALAELASAGALATRPGGGQPLRPNDIVIAESAWPSLSASLQQALTAYHRLFPLRSGAPREEIRSRLGLPARAFERVVALASTRQVVVDDDALLRLPDFMVTFSEHQDSVARRIGATLTQAAYAPPSVADLGPGVDTELLAALEHVGRLTRVSETLVFDPEAYATMVQWVQGTLAAHGSVTVSALRDRFATSRRHALAVLEHLDQRRITRREGDFRVRW